MADAIIYSYSDETQNKLPIYKALPVLWIRGKGKPHKCQGSLLLRHCKPSKTSWKTSFWIFNRPNVAEIYHTLYKTWLSPLFLTV